MVNELKSHSYKYDMSAQTALNQTTEEASEKKDKTESVASEEIVNAEIQFEFSSGTTIKETDIQKELEQVNQELERYTNHADREEYALAVGVGIVAGILDSVYVGEMKITGGDIQLSRDQVDKFVKNYAHMRGIGGNGTNEIPGLERAFDVAQDNIWKDAGIDVAAKNHHLADMAHHPTPVGLLSAIIVQFVRIGTFVNHKGEVHFLSVHTTKEDVVNDIIPAAIAAAITGILNWLVYQKSEEYEEKTGRRL